jgi:hypothetical protein
MGRSRPSAGAVGRAALPVASACASPQHLPGHPELVAATVQSAASDYAALAVARALQDVAAALAPLNGPGIVRATAVMRP